MPKNLILILVLFLKSYKLEKKKTLMRSKMIDDKSLNPWKSSHLAVTNS